MKLLLVIYSGADRRLVPALFDRYAVTGYTEMAPAHGRGQTGKRAGTRAWPEDSVVYFSVVAGEQLGELTNAIRAAASQVAANERLHAAVLPTETFF